MHWLPLVPFAGEEQLQPLLEGQNSSEAWVLLLSSIVKLLMLGLCLETGWRGGVFFPLFLVACALGMGMHLLLPDLGSLGSWCGALTGALYRFVLLAPWRFWCWDLPSCKATEQLGCWWALAWRS